VQGHCVVNSKSALKAAAARVFRHYLRPSASQAGPQSPQTGSSSLNERVGRQSNPSQSVCEYATFCISVKET